MFASKKKLEEIERTIKTIKSSLFPRIYPYLTLEGTLERFQEKISDINERLDKIIAYLEVEMVEEPAKKYFQKKVKKSQTI